MFSIWPFVELKYITMDNSWLNTDEHLKKNKLLHGLYLQIPKLNENVFLVLLLHKAWMYFGQPKMINLTMVLICWELRFPDVW